MCGGIRVYVDMNLVERSFTCCTLTGVNVWEFLVDPPFKYQLAKVQTGVTLVGMFLETSSVWEFELMMCLFIPYVATVERRGLHVWRECRERKLVAVGTLSN